MNLLELTSILANLCIIVLSGWLVMKYLVVKKYLCKYMDIDKILDELQIGETAEPRQDEVLLPKLEESEVVGQPSALTGCGAEPHYRERLIAVAASGNAKLYLGKNITTSEIESLEGKEVMRLYSRYEAYIGSVMTKSLKSAICGAYTTIVGLLVPSVSKGRYMLVEGERLSESLIENPVINLALSTYTCNLYHNYGHYLAPLTAGLLTSGHVKEAPPPSPPSPPSPPCQTEESKEDAEVNTAATD